jgi:predicted nucleotidyltransferase
MAVNPASLPITIDRERLASFCRRYHVLELSLFGSVLRPDFGPESDVDVLVELEPDHGLDLFDWRDMIGELESIFGRSVDLVSKHGIRNPYRRRNILSAYEVLHAG